MDKDQRELHDLREKYDALLEQVNKGLVVNGAQPLNLGQSPQLSAPAQYGAVKGVTEPQTNAKAGTPLLREGGASN